ncbi:excisionase family DNA binding protein [Arthrobacter sp. PL16]|nr:excisionase family DNA binding protein [Arthrobacter sp. PL16]
MTEWIRTGHDRKGAPMAERRFLTLADVGEVLNISSSQTYALVRSGELPAIQVGGRGQWRVETRVLEEYIAKAYEKTASALKAETGSSSLT